MVKGAINDSTDQNAQRCKNSMKGLRKLKIELSEAEVQTIFNALLERPFKEVFALVQKIQDIYKGDKE